MSDTNPSAPRGHVSFIDPEPSEAEFFEEYNKHNRLNPWFIIICILRSFAPFCLAIQTSPFDFFHSINHYLKDIVSKNRSQEVRWLSHMLYTSKCTTDQLETNLTMSYRMFRKNCKRQDFVEEMAVYKNSGYAIGALLGGISADLYGRRPTSLFFASFWFLSASAVMTIRNLEILQLFFVVIFAAASATNVVTFVNFGELAHKSNRILAVYTIPGYVLGIFIYKYISHKINSWLYLQAVTAYTVLPMIFGCWYIPESPRWLLCHYKKEAAFAILQDISGKNLYRQGPTSSIAVDIRGKWQILMRMSGYLFRKKLKTLLIFVILMIITTLFYSCGRWNIVVTAFRSKQFELLAGIIEAASFLFFIPLYMFLGKRYGLFALYLMLTVVTLVALLRNETREEAYYNAFALLFGISGLNLLWLFLLDAFPTFVRATVIGCCFCFFGLSTLTGILLIEDIESFKQLPYFLTFFISALIGSLVLLLPHPLKQDLPNSKLFPRFD